MSTQAFPKPGTVIDERYQLIEQIGIGGMGAVYKASCLQLANQFVAIKILKPTIQKNSEFRARFEREARIASQLNHPSIVKVTDYGTSSSGFLYMVLEYVEGEELRTLIKNPETEFSLVRAINLTVAGLAALANAHAAGVIHRDLKPRNIMVFSQNTDFGPQDHLQVLDFGIARVDDGQSLTAPGQVLGTVAYMAPEQTRLGAIDHRIDLYAMGCILYEMLCRRTPFEAKTIEEMIKKQRKAPVIDPRQFRADIPEALSQVIVKALAKDPNMRFQSAHEFIQALQQSLETSSPEARTMSVEMNPSQSGFGMSPEPLNGSQSGSIHDVTAMTPNPLVASRQHSQESLSNSFFTRLEDQVIDGKYKILEKLGEGGMGAVYKARHLMLNNLLALKVMHPQHASDATFRERFQREVKVMMTFVHSNAVTVRDYGVSNQGLLYMTMDFSEGQSLKSLIRQKAPMDHPRALAIGKQILEALAAGHKKGIVHRDIKPDNILVEDDAGHDFVKVLDFGIAKILEKEGANEKQGLTGSLVIGTPHYMSPEQANGESVDPRADIYAVGCVLYEMLSGHKVFEGTTVMQTLMAHVSQAPTPLRERLPEGNIPESVDRLVRKALAKDPQDRFKSATTFVAAINQQLTNSTSVKKDLSSDAAIEVSGATLMADIAVESDVEVEKTKTSKPLQQTPVSASSSNNLLTVMLGLIILALVVLVGVIATKDQNKVANNTPVTGTADPKPTTPNETAKPEEPQNRTQPKENTEKKPLPRPKPVEVETKSIAAEVNTSNSGEETNEPGEPATGTANSDPKSPEGPSKLKPVGDQNPKTDPKNDPKTPKADPKEPANSPAENGQPESSPKPPTTDPEIPNPKTPKPTAPVPVEPTNHTQPKDEPKSTNEPVSQPIQEKEDKTNSQPPAEKAIPKLPSPRQPIAEKPEPEAPSSEPVTQPQTAPKAEERKAKSPGLPTIAVMPFRFRKESVTDNSHGFLHSISTQETEQLTAELTRSLFETKKFAVVERQTVDMALREQDWANSGRLDSKQSVEYGKMLGATYLVTGELSFQNVESTYQVLRDFGLNEVRSIHKVGFFVEIRVIDSNTTRIVEALKIPSSASKSINGKSRVALNAAVAKELLLEARENLMKNCAWKIIDKVFPLKVAKIEGQTIYLNRGKNANLAVGQTFKVLRNGSPITDPDTNMVLGYKTTQVAKIRIKQIDQFFATAELVSGHAEVNAICELVKAPKPKPVQERRRVPGW